MATTNKNFRVKNGLDVNGEITVSAVGGDEGGQVNLEKPATNTTLAGNVAIDIYQNKIRFFEQGGSARGAYIDLTAASAGAASNLLAGGGSGISNVVEDTTPQLGGDLDAQSYDITNLNSLTFDTTPTSPETAAGTIFWDSGDGIAKAVLNANVTIGLGQESIISVKNATGSTLTKGTVVYINGAQGQMPTVALADADTEATSSKTFGFVAEQILDGAEGFVVTEGVLRGVNTDGFTEGNPIYLSSTAGQYTQTAPSEPAHFVFLGYAVKAHASAGEIIVKIQNGYELTELHGVLIDGTPADNEVLAYDTTSSLWINQTAAEAGLATSSHNHDGVYQPVGSYLTSETDPIFVASAVYGVTSTDIAHWNSAYGWGNHATAGYLTSLTGTLDGYAKYNIADIQQKTTSYTLVLTDANDLLEVNSSSGTTITVPTNASVAFPTKTEIHILQTGTGQITVAGDTGVTVNGTPGLKFRDQWSMATLIKRGTDTWILVGDLTG